MAESLDLESELEFVKSLATEAALVAKSPMPAAFRRVEKANRTYVTDLDQDLERLIRERLGRAIPRRFADGRGI